MPTAVWSLRWSDVDPESHPFDAARVATIVEGVLPENPPTSPQLVEQRRRLEERIDRALLAELGPWIAGWRWATSEPGCGGPVREYCCAVHSLKGPRKAVLDRVVCASMDWRSRLEELAARFAQLRDAHRDKAVDDDVSRAAARLLPTVLEWTGAEDAWYSTFERILAWYVEPRLADPERALTVVSRAIDGRFESWLSPEEGTAGSVVHDIGAAVAREVVEGPTRVDCLAEWLRLRESSNWASKRLCDPDPVTCDGHRRHIETVDAARDPDRASRMLEALAVVRTSAARNEPLTFERLRAWQRIVLDRDVDFRDAPAVAHGGAERYGLHADTKQRFESCLSEAGDLALPAVVRAARGYLDVCYFHPFPDGNARAARLALDHVLTSAGLGLHAAGPIVLVAKRALDRWGPYSLQDIVDYLAGPIGWSDDPRAVLRS